MRGGGAIACARSSISNVQTGPLPGDRSSTSPFVADAVTALPIAAQTSRGDVGDSALSGVLPQSVLHALLPVGDVRSTDGDDVDGSGDDAAVSSTVTAPCPTFALAVAAATNDACH